MNTSQTHAVAPQPGSLPRVSAGNRSVAIDAFRGGTIILMIFVNSLAGVRGVPAWMEHMPGDQDGMTFVDVICPAFLFIVGMSIPFAQKSRSAAGFWLQQRHVLQRALGLIVMGVFMVNAEEGYNEDWDAEELAPPATSGRRVIALYAYTAEEEGESLTRNFCVTRAE